MVRETESAFPSGWPFVWYCSRFCQNQSIDCEEESPVAELRGEAAAVGSAELEESSVEVINGDEMGLNAEPLLMPGPREVCPLSLLTGRKSA